MSIGGRAGLLVTLLSLAAACGAPPPTLPPKTATPNVVQTAQVLLTASFASLTPTASDTPGTPTPTASQPPTQSQTPTVARSQTLQASETPTGATATQTPKFTQTRSASPRSQAASATPRVSQTVALTATRAISAPTATLTPTAALRIVPGNAMSVTLRAVLGPVVISGTRVVRLDQAAWAPDGQLAAAGAGGVLFASGGTLTATYGYTTGAWTPTLSFSPDGLALAAGNVAGTIRLFRRANDSADGGLLLQLLQPGLRVSQVRYRPGPPGVLAQVLASLGGDNTIYVWDVAYEKFLGGLSPGPSSAQALEFSGDGRWLAAASGTDVALWDVNELPATGWSEPLNPTLTLAQAGEVTGLALSRDGFWLAAGNSTGTIELWTLPAGKRFEAFAWQGAAAQRLAFSPDGRLLATANEDRIIRLWALDTPAAPLAQLAGHTGPITSLAFSPDGTALASSSWDGTVRLWAEP